MKLRFKLKTTYWNVLCHKKQAAHFSHTISSCKRKTLKGKITNNRLKWVEECETYLTHICRQKRSIERSEWKRRKQELSANTIGCRKKYFYSWWKSQCWLKALVFYVFTFYVPRLSTDMSQVGIILFFPFQPILWQHFFITKLSQKETSKRNLLLLKKVTKKSNE